MTIGERIAQKRKELGLSQEALGERMGVSRQAIYKWESDAALPEIEKLVKLAREFGVSVGWLLGEEDNVPEKRELTPEQLAMVEEIVGRYLNARQADWDARKAEEVPTDKTQAPPEKPGRRWPWVLAGLSAVAVISLYFYMMLGSLSAQIKQVTDNYTNVLYIVNSQMNYLTGRVENALKQQDNLTVEHIVKHSADYLSNTVTLSIRALSPAFVEGMTAEFIVESGGESFTVPGELRADHAFNAEITVPLSDDILVSMTLITGDQRQTQLLDMFFSLYTESFPGLDLMGVDMWGSGNEVEGISSIGIEPHEQKQIQSIRWGLFQDRKLMAWYEQLDSKPRGYTGGGREDNFFFRLNEPQTLEEGHIYCQAAVVVDQYGRERIYPSSAMKYDPTRNIRYRVTGDNDYCSFWGTDPAGWEY